MSGKFSMERLVRLDEAGRDFDVEYWQALGDTAIVRAAWELAVTAAAARGVDAEQLQLHRFVEKLQRRRRPVWSSAGTP